jgi:hypothetical protein
MELVARNQERGMKCSSDAKLVLATALDHDSLRRRAPIRSRLVRPNIWRFTILSFVSCPLIRPVDQRSVSAALTVV